MAEEGIVITISDEEETGSEISAVGSPLSGVNSMISAAPIEMIIGDHNGPERAEQIRNETIGSVYGYATEEAATVQGSSSSSGSGFQQIALPSRQSSVMILGEFEQRRGAAEQEPAITVGDTLPGAQSNEAIYLSDSPLNTPESIHSTLDEQRILTKEIEEKRSVSVKLQKERSNSISLVAYTPCMAEEDIPRSLIREFCDDQTSSQSSISAQATSLNRKRNAKTNLQPPEGTDTSQARAYTQATTAAQAPSGGGGSSSSSNESTLAPLPSTTVNNRATSRSVPITVESPPSVVRVHPTTMPCSANQGPGSTIQSLVARISTQIVARSNSESTPQPTASQAPMKTVNANVLEQVVKLAASRCEQLKPDSGSAEKYEIYLYRLLTNFEEVSHKEHNIAIPGAASSTHIQSSSESHDRSVHESHSNINADVSRAMDDDVICVPDDLPPTSNRQAAVQQAVSSEPIVIDQSPEKSDTHNGTTPLQANMHQPSTSTPTTASKIEESISLTTESNLSIMHNESSLNSTLTEVTLEDSFDDECPTPVQEQSKFHSVLKREISNESTQSEQSAPPRKRPKMTFNGTRRALLSLTRNRERVSREGVITDPAHPGRDSHNTGSHLPPPPPPPPPPKKYT